MLVDKANLVTGCAARERSRFAFNGVQFGKDGTTTTNGKVLLHVPYPELKNEEQERFPNLDGMNASALPPESFIVPSDDCKAVAKSIPKAVRLLNRNPMLRHAAAEFNGVAKFGTTDGTAKAVLESKPVDGAFPKWESVMPKGDVQAVVALNPALLRDLLEDLIAVMDARGVESNAVVLEFRGKDNPVVLKPASKLCAGVVGLIMPVVLKG